MKKKFTKNDFVNAVKKRGGLHRMAAGGVPATYQSSFHDPIFGKDIPIQVPNPVANVGTAPTAAQTFAGPGQLDLAKGATGTPTLTTQPTQNGGVGSIFTPQSGYVAGLAPTTQLNYAPVANQAANNALAGQGQFQGNLAGEQALTQQFIAQGNGQGPNPAQDALNQNTGANTAAQNALMAGQRGASANAGLVGRQAAMQGAATQQQAVGQAATMQAQQQIAAQQQAAGMYGQMGSQITGQQNANAALFGAGAGANAAQNQNLVSNYGMAQGINAATSAANAAATGKTTGGLLGGLGAVGAAVLPSVLGSGAPAGLDALPDNKAMGGEIKPRKMAEGGMAYPSAPSPSNMAGTDYGEIGFGPRSFVGKYLAAPEASNDSGGGIGGAIVSGLKAVAPLAIAALNKGGSAPVTAPMLAAKGKTVPGKASVKGDNLKNDTVPAMLSPGEIVIPRSIATAPDAATKAAKFVQAIVAKQGLKRKK